MRRGRVHCIGIGGIGVSALARWYRAHGYRVSGSDLSRSEITDALEKEGIRIAIGHRKDNLAPSVTRIIHSAAVRPDNPELREARRRGILIQTYARALGELTNHYRTIAIAGAHGKSTTTALTALILTIAGSDPPMDPTVIIGTKLREFGNKNFRSGRSPWLVLEADEYHASFLNYQPEIAVVTNIDREHLDFFKSIRGIEAAFQKFLRGIRPGGTAILNRDDHRLRRIGRRLRQARPDIRIAWYSLRQPQAKRAKALLRIPGRHNISNALAAYAVGRVLKVPVKAIFRALGEYRGAWRRFDYQGQFSGAKVYADYAHHPTEIKATLQAAREKFPKRRIWCVFQPHHHERLRDLFRDFTRAFDGCDRLVLLPVYAVAGREAKARQAVTSQTLAQALTKQSPAVSYLADPKRLEPFLKQNLVRGDVVLMMGAGDIWEMTKRLMTNS